MARATMARVRVSKPARGRGGVLNGAPGARASVVLGRAADAVPGRRLGLEARLRDRVVAFLALPVGALVELAQRVLDVVERLAQLAGDHLGLAPLGRHLAGVGEVGVVLESGLAVAEAKILELRAQSVPLGLERGAQPIEGGIRRHGASVPGQSGSLCTTYGRARTAVNRRSTGLGRPP